MITPAATAIRNPATASTVVTAAAAVRSGQVRTIEATIWLGAASVRSETPPTRTHSSQATSSPPTVRTGGSALRHHGSVRCSFMVCLLMCIYPRYSLVARSAACGAAGNGEPSASV